MQRRVFQVESSSEAAQNAPKKNTRKRGTTLAAAQNASLQIGHSKDFKEDKNKVQRRLFSASNTPLMKTENPLDDPGQYTESLFNFPADGTEEPTDPKSSIVKDLKKPGKK
jgi:hypothetical protein